jgi:hypothetical protein
MSLAEFEQSQPSFVFDVRDERGADVSSVAVLMDGEPLVQKLDGRAVGVDLGEHVLSFLAGPPYKDQRVTVLARTGERNRVIVVRLQPDTPPQPPSNAHTAKNESPSPQTSQRQPLPIAPIALAGLGVVALGAFAYLGLSAKSDLRALEADPCATTKTCSDSDVSSVRTRYLIADASLVVGAAAFVAAAWLWITREPAKQSSLVPVDVRPTANGLTVQLQRTF